MEEQKKHLPEDKKNHENGKDKETKDRGPKEAGEKKDLKDKKPNRDKKGFKKPIKKKPFQDNRKPNGAPNGDSGKEKVEKPLDTGVEEVVEEREEQFYKVLGVMFEVTKKRYYFEVVDNVGYKRGEKVVVDTARGKEVGVVYGEARMLSEKELVLPLKPVLKKASDEEITRYNNLREEAEAAYLVCKHKIFKHELPMKLVASEFTFDKSKLIFYFTAEGRIDFRELVKDLATVFKLRIELRQIGVRDEARILGSIGICGKELCCRTFINKFDSVSIKMARDQGLVINPAKISGACGRLLCCIKYEYSQYSEALKGYPAVHQIVETTQGTGKVMSVNPLNGYLYVDVQNKGILKLNLDELKFNVREAKKMQNKLSPEEKKLRGLEKE